MPHPPQLFESAMMLTQVPVAFSPTDAHSSEPAGHEATHAPLAHTSLPGHCEPQVPPVHT